MIIETGKSISSRSTNQKRGRSRKKSFHAIFSTFVCLCVSVCVSWAFLKENRLKLNFLCHFIIAKLVEIGFYGRGLAYQALVAAISLTNAKSVIKSKVFFHHFLNLNSLFSHFKFNNSCKKKYENQIKNAYQHRNYGGCWLLILENFALFAFLFSQHLLIIICA